MSTVFSSFIFELKAAHTVLIVKHAPLGVLRVLFALGSRFLKQWIRETGISRLLFFVFVFFFFSSHSFTGKWDVFIRNGLTDSV